MELKEVKLIIREVIEECCEWTTMDKLTWWEVEDIIKERLIKKWK